ncbi:MAG: methylenetetrahydrofolate reductase [Magnetococcales bacterium]|nr:methylenetetrahydrofolate reductase [Magnetococcales bacterium]
MSKSSRPLTRISIELVPRDENSLKQDLKHLKEAFHGVNTVNIPDLAHFSMRSWQGCAMAKDYFPSAIPHIRAMDLKRDEPLPMVEYLRKHGIKEVLVVTGDKPAGELPPDHATAVDIIRKFKEEMPEVNVYAAIDQYRNGFQTECEYVQRKRDAGASGFFTQPFFDLRLMEIYAEMFAGIDLFFGVSPVISDRSVAYWRNNNKVIFPKGFIPSLGWNRDFTSQALSFARKMRINIYIMPIRVDIKNYLTGIIS